MITKHHYSRAALQGLFVGFLAATSHAQTAYSPTDRDALARSAYARGDIPRAAAALNESVRVNPFDPVALNNLAVNYAAQGDYQNALSLLERALRIAPNRSDIMNNHANLRAWMSQESQFALGSRPTNTPLNFPRAEDAPQNFPPLWSPPQQMQNPPVVRSGQQNLLPPVGNQPGYATYPSTQSYQAYPQQIPGYSSNSQSQQSSSQGAPIYQTTTAPMPVYQQAPPLQQAILLSQASQPVPVIRKQAAQQLTVAPQSTDLNVVRKKKRPVAVDCKVEP